MVAESFSWCIEGGSKGCRLLSVCVYTNLSCSHLGTETKNYIQLLVLYKYIFRSISENVFPSPATIMHVQKNSFFSLQPLHGYINLLEAKKLRNGLKSVTM